MHYYFVVISSNQNCNLITQNQKKKYFLHVRIQKYKQCSAISAVFQLKCKINTKIPFCQFRFYALHRCKN